MFPIYICVRTFAELDALRSTYEARFAGVDERLGGEPLPHECAGGAVIHGVDQATNIIVDC